MELTYPINLSGHEDGDASGEVLTRHGEYLGKWTFTENEAKETGVFHFIVDGEIEPLFSEAVSVTNSGLLTGWRCVLYVVLFAIGMKKKINSGFNCT